MSKKEVLTENQYVTFQLGKEVYGIDIHKVTTIERMNNVTRVPKAPDYVQGVMSLRGEVVPVIDLRKRFNLQKVAPTDDTRIIVFKVEDVVLGMIVDIVNEVVSIPVDNIENAPANAANEYLSTYINGVGKLGGKIVTLLNLESMMENTQE